MTNIDDDKTPEGLPVGKETTGNGSLSRSLDTVLAASSKEGRGINSLMTDPDSVRLVQALKEDREGKKGTKVEMAAIAPGDEAGFREWMDKYTTIFTDPNDMEDEETIRGNWEKGMAILYMVEGEMPVEGAEPIRRRIGIRLAVVNPQVPDSTYVPYGGVDEAYQGKLVYTRAIKHNEAEMAKRGISVILNDCEDSTRMAGFRESYPGKSDAQIAEICADRLRFFMKNGYRFIDDPDVKYCRPASDDTSKIQSYDRLGFKLIGNEAAYEKYLVRNESGVATHITKEGYRKMYLALHTLDQYSELTETELRAEFPAINKFLTELDGSPKNEFPFYVDTTTVPSVEPKRAGAAGAPASKSAHMPMDL